MAISIGHDIGHPPFGHDGERVLSNFTKNKLGYKFWHEKNSLRFTDYIETLPTQTDKEVNLNLTYAVKMCIRDRPYILPYYKVFVLLLLCILQQVYTQRYL